MYNVSDNYKTYIKKPSRSFESKITISNRTFNNNDVIQIVPSIAQPSDGFSIGNTVSQSVDITLKNDGGVYASVGVVNVEIGLKTGNSIEYIPIGTFNIDDVVKTDYTVKLTCYDNMIKFETPYFSSLGNTPTLQQVVDELASTTGVEFTGTVPNYTVTKLQGYTCREVLGYVASVCGGNAYITRDGKFTIVYPTEVDCIITADNYINGQYTAEDSTYKIGMITCQNKSNSDSDTDDSEDYDSVNDKNTISVGDLSSDTMELDFENPWVTTAILNDIYNKLKNFSYLGYKMKWQGDLSLDPGDIITIVDNKNVTRKAYIFDNKLTYNGGLIADTSAKGETKNSNSFDSSGPSTKDIQRLSVQLLIAEKAIINKASIKDLQATNARIENLEASVATIDTALINYATITQLDAVKANIADLNASIATIDSALINKANVADLTATNATVSNLSADVANIKTLVNGNLTSANIQSLVLTSSKVTVDNGFIKNAMIESLDATKINTGSLNTSKISVTSSDGSLLIAGATQQFKDKNGKVRIQMGQDAQGNFNFILVASDGSTTLIDGTGVKANAIADKLIKTNMVADQAITSQQINYSSFATGFNAETNTNYINSSKVAIDLTGQTLDISFSNMNTTVNGLQTTTSNNSTAISAIQGQISTLISNTTITQNGTTTQLKDAYNSTVSTINSMQTTIGQHTSEINANTGNITSINSNITSIQASLSSISASLSSTQSTVTSQGTQITTANNSISTLNTNVSNVTSRVSSLELTTSGLTTRVGNTETAISSLSIGGRNLLLKANFSSSNYISSGMTNGKSGYGFKMLTSETTPTRTITGLKLKINTSYTISFIAWCDSGTQIINNDLFPDTLPEKTFTITTTATKYLWTLNSSSADMASCTLRFFRAGTISTNIYITDIKLEEGNQATDWTPAPEDVDSSIASVKDYATQTINSNVSTINQTTDSIKASVQSLQSSVSTINTTLGNKADTTTVTNVTNRVSTLESSITGINASITTLNSNVSSVTTTANNALNSINNLQVGGRNLYTYYNTFTIAQLNAYVGTFSRTDDTSAKCGKLVTITCTTAGTGFYYKGFDDFTVANKVYTWSLWAKCSTSKSGTIGYERGGQRSVTLTTDWQKITCTFTANNNQYSAFTWYLNWNAGEILYIKDIKCEEGTFATDWTPAPEDIQTQITTTNSNVSTLQSSVSVLQSQIALKVEQTNIDSAVTTINGQIASTNATISSMQSSINLQLNSITSKVNKTVSTKNLINNPAFNNTLGDYSATNTPYGVQIVNYTTYANSWGHTKLSLCDNALWIRYDSTGDNYVEFKNLYAKVKASTTYTISYYYLLNSSNYTAGSSFIYERTAAQWNQITFSTPTLIGPDSVSASTWVRYTKTFTTQSTTDSIMLRFGWHGSGEMFVSAIQLEEGASTTDWVNSANSVVGTSITQSPVDVMTAFNNISQYFQVSTDGAKFGDFSTGGYTKMSQKGLEHVDSTGSKPYFYRTYVGELSVDLSSSDYGSKQLTITIPSDAQSLFNGYAPIPVFMIEVAYPINGNQVIQRLGAYGWITNSINLYVVITCQVVTLSTSLTNGSVTTSAPQPAHVNVRYVLMG